MCDSKCVFTVDLNTLKQSRNEKLHCVSILKKSTSSDEGNPRGGKQTAAELPGTITRHLLAKTLWPDGSDKCSTEQGVNSAQFSAHSTRAASTSAALSSGVPEDAVLRAAELELGVVNMHTVLQKGTIRKWGASPAGFLSPQELE